MSRLVGSNTVRPRRTRQLVVLGLLVAVLGPHWRDAAAQPDETAEAAALPLPTLDGDVPLTVFLPSSVTTPEEARPFFDAFSWQSFIALNWPATPYPQRGVPFRPNDSTVFLDHPEGAQPVVWGTYKEEFELFDQGPFRPMSWESLEIPVRPCPDAAEDARIFVRYSKGDSIVEESNQAFSYPLIDQNNQYAVYEVRFNRAQYNFVRGNDASESSWLYLARNLAAKEPISMPASRPPRTQGALMVKAGWKVLDGDDEGRYYSIEALVLNTQTGDCEERRLGLVGIHIVQKLAAFPQWIWSSFEHADNVPDGPVPPCEPSSRDVSSGSYSFNNGTPCPQTIGGWANRPPSRAPDLQDAKDRQPVQVTRFNPIPESTRALNRAVQREVLANTVWQNYQLVITQWPSNPNNFVTMENGGIYPANAGGAFPVNGAVNAVMETYLQSGADAHGAYGNSCMSCHYAAGQADFSWTLMRGAH